MHALLLGLGLLAAAEPTTVAVFPLENVGLGDADAQDLMRRVTADLAARPGVAVPGGRQATLDIAAALGDELGACRTDAACLTSIADSTGVAHLVLVRVEVVADSWQITTALHAGDAGAASTSFTRTIKGTPAARVDQTRLTVAALASRFGTAGDGEVVLNVEEDDAQLFVDGEPRPHDSGEAIIVSTGAHLFELRKEGFVPFAAAVEVPTAGQVVFDAPLEPTQAFLDDYNFWAWTLTSTWIALGAVGLVGVVIGGAVGAGSFGLVLYANQAIREYNEAMMPTQEQTDFFNQLPLIAYGGYAIAVVVGIVSLVPLLSSPVVFLFADSPFRYSE